MGVAENWRTRNAFLSVPYTRGDTPIPEPKAGVPITGPAKLISTPILGGLHHRYQRVVV